MHLGPAAVAAGRCSGILTTMAFVVARRDGRFEIRESTATPRGPRARTLATFRAITPEVLDLAESRAVGRFDRQRIEARALELGAANDDAAATRAGWDLVARLASGDGIPPTLRSALASQLGADAARLADSIPPVLEWLGVGLHERGDALRDLLRMTDRLPARSHRPGRAFPRIASRTR